MMNLLLQGETSYVRVKEDVGGSGGGHVPAAPDFMTASDSDALYVNEGFTNGLTNGSSGSTHIIRCYYSLVVISY